MCKCKEDNPKTHHQKPVKPPKQRADKKSRPKGKNSYKLKVKIQV